MKSLWEMTADDWRRERAKLVALGFAEECNLPEDPGTSDPRPYYSSQEEEEKAHE